MSAANAETFIVRHVGLAAHLVLQGFMWQTLGTPGRRKFEFPAEARAAAKAWKLRHAEELAKRPAKARRHLLGGAR